MSSKKILFIDCNVFCSAICINKFGLKIRYKDWGAWFQYKVEISKKIDNKETKVIKYYTKAQTYHIIIFM